MKLGLFRGDSGLSIALGFVAFLGAAHVLIRTAIYGIPLESGDPLVYVHFAETLAAGDGFAAKDGFGRLIRWPPLLSVLLAFFRLFGVEPSEAGRYLNIICFGLIILVAGHWLHRYIKFRLVVIGTTVTIMVSYPLARVSSFVLTETLFILITLLALVQMESFLSGRRPKSGFLLSIVFSAMAPMTRYIGVTVIFTGIFLILTRRGSPTRLRWKHATFYGVVSLLPLALWLTRNRIVSGTLVGSRTGEQASGLTLWDSLSTTGDLLYLWTFVTKEPGWLKIMLVAASILIVLQSVTLFTRRRNPVAALRETWGEKRKNSEELKARPAVPFAAFTIVYFIALIVISPYIEKHEILPRWLSIVYVPAAVAAAVWLDKFLFVTYSNSGILAWKNPEGWGIRYNKAAGQIAVTKWILIGLILNIILASNIRNIVLYIDVLITYDPPRYLL